MDYRQLGRSGLRVSPLCLGAMMFGGATDEPTSARIIGRAREQGVNFVDTADVYNEGRSEEVVGRAIRADRGWWVLATKLANPTGPGPNDRGLSRRHCLLGAEASLRRLGTEAIDILYLHKEDHATPLAETVRAMADLVRAGKIRHFGVSNYRAWRVAEICRLCDESASTGPWSASPATTPSTACRRWSTCRPARITASGVVPYSPLARGV
jgi:aryl-alcohol dehydrogenase-like predicted oxidoreductase